MKLEAYYALSNPHGDCLQDKKRLAIVCFFTALPASLHSHVWRSSLDVVMVLVDHVTIKKLCAASNVGSTGAEPLLGEGDITFETTFVVTVTGTKRQCHKSDCYFKNMYSLDGTFSCCSTGHCRSVIDFQGFPIAATR